MNLALRLCNNWKGAVRFNQAGATWGSVFLYPIRRRFGARQNVLRLSNGLTITTPQDVELTALFDEIWVHHCYCPTPLRRDPDDVVIDIGAHVGVFTLWAANQFPDSRIIAVEPCAGSFAILQENITQNGLTMVQLLNAACSDHIGNASLYSRGPSSMNTLYRRDVLNSSFRQVSSVPVVSLDGLFEKFRFSSCSLLKLDCEGAEYAILMKASNESLRRIANIAMEYHRGLNDETPERLAEFLNQKGFNVALLPPRSEEDGYLYASRR